MHRNPIYTLCHSAHEVGRSPTNVRNPLLYTLGQQEGIPPRVPLGRGMTGYLSELHPK
jgi:hypothetical protein